jgi:ABC-type multidrug transport system fused ATPase/permease subunit
MFMMAQPLAQIFQLLFSNYRGPILITYGLTILENLFELLYPFAIGMTIDNLLKGNYATLIVLAGIWLIPLGMTTRLQSRLKET